MSEGTPKTWFSGRSAPEDQRGINPAVILGLAFFVLSPIGVLVTVTGYLTFSLAKFSWKVIGGTALIYTALWAVLGGAGNHFLHRYAAGDRAAFAALQDGTIGAQAQAHWFSWLWAQVPFSLVVGGLGATVYSWWRWTRRASWEKDDRVPGPLDVLRRRRLIQSIQADRNGPRDGATLGYTSFGHRIVQTEAEAAAHTLVAGGSGSGKTTTMLIGIRDAIRRGEPVLFIDLKGAVDVPEQLAQWAARYNRKFLHWTIQNPREPYPGPAEGPAFYDPIGRGDPSRRKDLLIGSEKWDVEYYKTVNANYLQLAFAISDRTAVPGVDSFSEIAELLNYDVLIQRAASLIDASVLDGDGILLLEERQPWQMLIPHITDPDLQSLLEAVMYTVAGLDKNEQERSAIRNMRARLQVLTQSVAGYWLRKSPTGDRNIDLRRVVDEGWVVVFSLDSSNYEDTAKQIGGLIIQDLKTLSSELRHDPAQQTFHVYVDEFSAIGSDNVLGLLARARDARMPVTLSTQAIADLTRADPSFPNQVMGIIGSFIIHRANLGVDAQIFAELTGEHTVYRTQMGVEMTSGGPGGVSTGAATGHGMIREDKEYRVLPEEFQQLEQGHLIYIAKSPRIRHEKEVTVVKEDPTKVSGAATPLPAPSARPALPAGALTTSEASPAEAIGDLPDGMDARALSDGQRPNEHRTIAPPVPFQAPSTEVQRPVARRPIVPMIDPSAPVQRSAQEPTSGPGILQEPETEPGAHATPPPAVPHRAEPLIDPAAFRSRAAVPAASPATPPAESGLPRPAAPVAPAVLVSPLPRPVQQAAEAIEPGPSTVPGAPFPGGPTPRPTPVHLPRPSALPVRPPAPLTAPWITGDTVGADELGVILPSPSPDLGEEQSAFALPADADADWVAATDDEGLSGGVVSPTEYPTAAEPAVVPDQMPEVTSGSGEPQVTPHPGSTHQPDVPNKSVTGPSRKPGTVYDESEW